MAQAVRSLSPKRLAERARLRRQAVALLARLAAKRAVQDELRAQGVRVSLVLPRDIAEKASAYLAAHPELYQQALVRAHKLGYVDPRFAEVINNARKENEPKSITLAVQMLGAK